MLYFILWAVFALAVVIAVPVAHMLDQRGRPRPDPIAAGNYDDADLGGEESFDDEPLADEPPGGGFGREEVVDDFGAFDDEFK